MQVYGKDSSGKIIPLTVDANGHLQIDVLSILMNSKTPNLDASGDFQVDVKSILMNGKTPNLDASGDFQTDILSIATGSNLIGRVDARDGDKLFSYAGRVQEYKSYTSSGSGVQILSTTAVPSGEVHVITNVAGFNNTRSVSYAQVRGQMNSEIVYLRTFVPLARYETAYAHGWFVLAEGDYLGVRFISCSAGDAIYMTASGFKFNI